MRTIIGESRAQMCSCGFGEVVLMRGVCGDECTHGHEAIRAFIDFENLLITMEINFDMGELHDHFIT